jgi:hypothetical protein
MTRASITQGLLQNASDRLGLKSMKTQTSGNPVSNAINNALNPTDPNPNSAARIRLQVQKAADYDAIEAPKIWLR